MTLDSDLSPEKLSLINRCQTALAIEFDNKQLLASALTHSSSATTALDSNERMEFLGDSVLGFVVCRYLFGRFPDWNEGELTKVKSAVVSGQTCADWARKIGLDQLIVVGKGVAQNGELPNSLLSDVFESVVAAIYLDQGLEVASNFLVPLIIDQVETVQKCSAAMNFKSALQNLAQREYSMAPTYCILDEQGPDHDKSFYIAAKIGDREFAPAWGKSKKEAEQRAAGLALEAIGYPVDLSQSKSDSE